MRIETKRSFTRDMRRVRNTAVRRRVERKLREMQNASSITEILDIRRINSGRGRHYRVRVGDYRIGFALEGDVAVLYRLLPRDEIYRRFP